MKPESDEELRARAMAFHNLLKADEPTPDEPMVVQQAARVMPIVGEAYDRGARQGAIIGYWVGFVVGVGVAALIAVCKG